MERLFRNGYPFSILQSQEGGKGREKKNPKVVEPPPPLPRKTPKSPLKKKKGTRYVPTIPTMKNILGELQKTYI
jgi:hypothetical protein